MIKSLEIQNFQSHKLTKLEFSKEVNIITGASDCGKTAIIRALRWLIWNRPTGDAFRSDWGGETSVIIETESNPVSRVKDKNKNHYYLEDMDFAAFGTDIPKEIQENLNLNEINLQMQLDRPFLLSDSPGEVAQHFNHIAHLDQIDDGLRNVQKWIREIEQNLSSCKQQKEDAEKQLINFTHLDRFEEDLEVLEDAEMRLKTKINQKTKLTDLIQDIVENEKQIQSKSVILKYETSVDNLLNQYEKLKQLKISQNKLVELIEELNRVNIQESKLKRFLPIETIVLSMLNALSQKREKEKELTSLKTLLSQIKSLNENCIIKEQELTRLEKQFNDKFPDICPLCGKPK